MVHVSIWGGLELCLWVQAHQSPSCGDGTGLIAGYLYLSFLSLHFTFLFHSESFQNSSPTLLQVLQSLS